MSEEEQIHQINETPAPQAIGAGKGGIVPPVETRWQPGQSGNPAGRKTAGALVKEEINSMALAGLTEQQIKFEARDPKNTWQRRMAAEQMLVGLEHGDIADFAGLLRGENTIEDLKGMGINTEVIKKLKQKSRKVPVGEGQIEEVIDREIELHDRRGAEFDRVCDRTDGKPNQPVEVVNGVPVMQELATLLAESMRSINEAKPELQ
jgi:hypothetical protein